MPGATKSNVNRWPQPCKLSWASRGHGQNNSRHTSVLVLIIVVISLVYRLPSGQVNPVWDHRPLEFVLRENLVIEAGDCVRLTIAAA